MIYDECEALEDFINELEQKREDFIETCIGDNPLSDLALLFDMEGEDAGSIYDRAYKHFSEIYDDIKLIRDESDDEVEYYERFYE